MPTVRPGFERFPSVRSASAPTFSPDGRRIAFIGDLSGFPELWAVETTGGWPDQLTFFRDRVLEARYSPARDEIVLGADWGGDERAQLFQLAGTVPRDGAAPQLRQLTDAPQAIHHLGGWSHDGSRIAFASNARNPFFFDVYLQEPASGEARRVVEHDGSWYARAFRPDGGALLVARVNRSGDDDLFLLDLDSRDLRHLTPHEGLAQYQLTRFSPDGARIWCVSDQDADFAGLGYVDVAAARFVPVARPEWDVEDLAVTRDGARLAYAINVDGYSELRTRETATGEERSVEGLPSGVISGLTWSGDGSRLALTLTTAARSPDIWLVEAGGVRQLTHSPQGGLSRAELAEPETIRYATFDNRQIPALFFRPKGAGPWPCVVHVHGGPESQVRPAWNPVIQYLVFRGYAVLAPNVRGSTGYGKAYSHLDDQERRLDAVADLEAAWKWLVGPGGIDPKRIAVMGASYGGFMTVSAVTRYPELWAAGVDIVGLVNFETFFQRTGPWRRQHRASEYGDPETRADLLRRISPIHSIDRIQAPMFVLHGRNDPRVPVEEAEQIVANLHRRGLPHEYLVFDDEGHGIVKLGNRIEAYSRIAEFLDRYVARR